MNGPRPKLPSLGPRAAPAAFGNDLLGDANPPGLMRAMVFGRPFQLIVLPDKVMQLFEWTRVWREIHTDGRKAPEDTSQDNLEFPMTIDDHAER